MRISLKYLIIFAVLAMAAFIIILFTSLPSAVKIEVPLQHPGYEPPAEFHAGIPLEEMKLEIQPYCNPVQVTGGLSNKKIPAIAASAGVEAGYYAHIIWSEPENRIRELWESFGPIDGKGFENKRRITQPDGYDSFNAVAVTGVLMAYLGYMDESVNTREIWFSAGDIRGWSAPEIVSDADVDSRSWGALPVAFFDGALNEIPIMLWFDHRFIKHEILMKERDTGVTLITPTTGFALKEGEWGDLVRVTDDNWFQYDPNADWSSGYDGLEKNVIHLVYMDSRYGMQVDEHVQHEGNCEIFYRTIKPKDSGWDIGDEVQLSFTEGVSDIPRVCGNRYYDNNDLTSAGVVWHEIDMNAGTGEIYFCRVYDGERGELMRLNPPGTVAVNADIISLPLMGHEDLIAVAYQQYAEGETFPLGNCDIYLRIVDGEKISDPIQVSDSLHPCTYPRMTHPGMRLENDTVLMIAWAEYRGGREDLTGESQIFYRSYMLRELQQWPPESQTYRRDAEESGE